MVGSCAYVKNMRFLRNYGHLDLCKKDLWSFRFANLRLVQMKRTCTDFTCKYKKVLHDSILFSEALAYLKFKSRLIIKLAFKMGVLTI